MGKTHKTAQGRSVDMEALRLRNESTIAVGNMKVNARGDQLGPGGKVVRTREELMAEHYNSTIGKKKNPTPGLEADEPGVVSPKHKMDDIPTSSRNIDGPAPDLVGGQIKKIEPAESTTDVTVTNLKGGLAQAMARASANDSDKKKK